MGIRRKLREAAVFLRNWAVNKPVVWTDANTKEVACVERYGRREYWQIFKPIWMQLFATTGKPCGCRKRLGIWPVLTCSRHMPEEFRSMEDHRDGT